MKKLVLLLALIFSVYSFSQQINCNRLLEFVESEGYGKGSLSSYTLNSSWLYKVTAYEYDYRIYVVAEIKRNEYSFSTNTYIFCGIPSQNWSNFRYGRYGDSNSYGKDFTSILLTMSVIVTEG